MKINILNESGYCEAMLGLSLSYNKPVGLMKDIADKLYNKNKGHNKFLESICVWTDITAPRYWWAEFDTYRVGTTKQSESTMHTLFKRELTQDDFVLPIYQETLDNLNTNIVWYKDAETKESKNYWLAQIKRNLPEGFLQRRVVCTNYKVLRHIIEQRKNHRLSEWKFFCEYLQENCRYNEWLK